MRAAFYRTFEGPIEIVDLPEPRPEADGVVVRVDATGLCRSDWHGWMGHDADIALPHVPGHELAGVITEIGAEVRDWRVGDRVTVPFVAGCGKCEACMSGNEQVCEYQFQPGFTAWGSFAEFVALRYADRNLVRIPEPIASETAAILGCRFATAFRAVVDQGRVAPEQWVAIHGCGGVGLAAVMIARAFDARVVAIDPDGAALDMARRLGADEILGADGRPVTPQEVADATAGGPHLSIDAIGSTRVVATSIESLRRRGRHVQVGLIPANLIEIPIGPVIARELEILGSHGMQAHRYPQMLDMIVDGRLEPHRLITNRISLSDVVDALPGMGGSRPPGVTVVDRLDV
jgi:D-arabinose 1-dehydrogenase-like Zn-dependent alcohol dehydrogenase